MNTTNFILTNRKNYTREEAYKLFSKNLDEANMEILADHVCIEDISRNIFSFTTQNNILFLTLGNGEPPFAVTKK